MLVLMCIPFMESTVNAADFPAGNVTKARVMAAESNPDNWMTYGRTYSDQRFSPLQQINADNIDRLGLAWYADIPSRDGLSATPLVVDGVVYMSAPFSRVYAYDARDGKLIWNYDPNVRRGLSFSNGWTSRINRGIAVWEGKVFVATGDCRLVAINAASGIEEWVAPVEDLQPACDPDGENGMDGAPRVANGKVYIGSGVADFGSRGVISAYDVNTGHEVWRFYTVPGDPAKGYENKAMEMAAKTWPEGWAPGGGASVWETIVYDKELNSIYFGTDAGSPLNAGVRSPGGGDNLFTNSIVAVDADTGEYKWHYQTVPHDAWDYNANMPIVLAELKIEGRVRKVLMQAPKSGFFYVIDRTNGEFISAEKYAKTTWASHYDPDTGRPVELPGARYYQNPDGKAIVYPSIWGAHNWQPMSYSSLTKLVYFSAWDIPALYEYRKDAKLGGVLVDNYIMGNDAEAIHGRGSLLAWDPVRQTARWKIPQDVPINGGTLSTGGNLVFHGAGTGELNAYSADKGQLLWSVKTGSSIQTGPITYRVDGRQIILTPVGAPTFIRNALPDYGASRDARGPARLMAFALDEKNPIPPAESEQLAVPLPPEQFGSQAELAIGKELFNAGSCWICHGEQATGFTGSATDLRTSPMLQSREAWYQVVVKGIKRSTGMIGHDYLSEDDAEALRAFVVKQAWKEYDLQNEAQ
jgi:PQQ-dependent dehydrogenase (methanol/ethanol family)